MRTAVASVLGGLGLTAAALCQGRTFVVDAANGPGTHFLDLPPAMAQAQHGDVYLVRAGSYSPTVVTRGVRLLGTGRPAITPAAGIFSDTLVVTGIPAGETFTMHGFLVQHDAFGSRAVECNGNLGHVHFEDTDFHFLSATTDPGATINTQGCREVTFTACRSYGYARFSNSDVWLVDCHLRGNDETATLEGHAAIYYVGGFGAFSLAGGSYVGGNNTRRATASPGVYLSLGTMVLTGDATTVIRAGTGPAGTSAGAINTADATILLDPQLTLVPSGGAPPIVEVRPGTVRLRIRPTAYLSLAGAAPGGRLQGMLRSGIGDTFLLACSLPADPIAYHDWRALVSVQAHVGLAYGVLTTPTTSIDIPVPLNPSLRGTAFAFQAGVLYAGTAELGLSNAAVVVVGN